MRKQPCYLALAELDGAYGVARIRVPHRPDILECHSADDVFKLYWRYADPKRMGYASRLERELQSGQSHAEKIIDLIKLRKVTTLITYPNKKTPLVAAVLPSLHAEFNWDVLHRTIEPLNSLPYGLGYDMGYMTVEAWKLLYAYMSTLHWPGAQQDIPIWDAPGKGRDSAVKIPTTEIITPSGKKRDARLPTKERREEITRLMYKAMKNGESPRAAELCEEFNKYNRDGRRWIVAAMDKAREMITNENLGR